MTTGGACSIPLYKLAAFAYTSHPLPGLKQEVVGHFEMGAFFQGQ